LIYGAAGSEVVWDGSSVLVGGGLAVQELSVGYFAQPVQVTPGAVWASLVLETARGRWQLGGFRQSEAESLALQVNDAFRTYAARILQTRCEVLQVLAEEIQALQGSTSYVRDPQRAALVARCERLCSGIRDGLWLAYASTEQNASFEVVRDFITRSQAIVAEVNARFAERAIERFRDFFDTVESKPLTPSQRLACVRDEASNLVLAGAGTGKTSTMIGRAGYLMASEVAEPSAILMIAYARKAAEEMQERQDARLKVLAADGTPKIKTFHALGLEIIGKAEGRRPDISPLAEDAHAMAAFVDDQLELNCEDKEYQAKLVRYCGTDRFPYRSPFDFDTLEDYEEYVRLNELRTLKGELVKSFEELAIANTLNAYGVPYEYERPYEHDTAGPDYRQYRPDFYLPQHGVYLEHFALGADGLPPRYFDQQKYLDGIAWKRDLHLHHGTRLLETYSHLKREDRLESTLLAMLAAVGVELVKRPDEEMLEELRQGSQVAELAVLLADFLTLFKESGRTLSALRETAGQTLDRSRIGLVLELVEPVLTAYTEKLHADGHIDFADMILRATEHVRTGRFTSPYTHIMIDEFQDISATRAGLVAALRAARPEGSLFAVGDDWQAIYRFAGSDISHTRDFAQIYGAAAVTVLDRTFRFNDKIGQVASNFVLKNPAQVHKTVESLAVVSEPAVSMVRTSGVGVGLTTALGAIDAMAERGAAVLVLARFHHVFKDPEVMAVKRRLGSEYPSLKVEFMTVHAAKGREADFVVVLGLTKGKWGFPSEKPADALMEYLLPAAEQFPLAEERRLFYVALTRARHRVYLVYNPSQPSSFVLELLGQPGLYPVASDEFSGPDICEQLSIVKCPACRAGVLVPRSGPYGQFAGCDTYPYCRHSEKLCPKCGGLMSRSSGTRVCTTAGCETVIPVCSRCGADLVLRSGRYGKFWGCSNFGHPSFPCRHKEKLDAFDVGRRGLAAPRSASEEDQ
jgi:DNA helicase-4